MKNSLALRAGDLVEVRSLAEIQDTLDGRGRLEGLPFMPEMIRYCGRRYRVFRRVEKIFLDFHFYVGEIPPAVLLEDVRCDGLAHGGCQMACLILWREEWLRRVDCLEGGATGLPLLPPISVDLPTTEDGKYVCQATQLPQLATHLPGWKPGQYVRDYLSGNRSAGEIVRAVSFQTWNRLRARLGRVPVGSLRGPHKKTPADELNLQPGELVQVRSRDEIEATLDYQGKNRGLAFAADMLRYCGRTYRVAHRVDRSIIEWSGDLHNMSHTVALDGVTCSGLHQRGCPRACFHLWRESWLKRVGEDSGMPAPARGKSGSASRMVHFRRRLGLGLAAELRTVLGSRARGRFGILMYHRVAPRGDVPLPPGTVSSARFRRQLQGLLDRGFTPWPLRRVLQELAAGRPIPPRTFVVTFDDGYECVYQSALPILKELNVPATIFLVTSHLDCPDPFSFDVWLIESKGPYPPELGRSVSTAQCREMLAGGLVELGSHTHTHPRLTGDAEALGSELRASLEVLRERFGLADATFAYPFGDWDSAMAEEARRTGLLCALTTQPRLVDPGDDRFAWGRFEVESYDTARTLAAKLDGWYSWLRELPLRRQSEGKGATG